MSETQLPTAIPARQARDEPWLQPVRESLRGLQYGSVVIIVQDGVVVQVDRTDKRRLRQRQVPS
ncbi:MAG: DUF2292 domain-containing protein [Thermoguttaceae bacterium]|jgi:hypothetical protein